MIDKCKSEIKKNIASCLVLIIIFDGLYLQPLWL